ELYNTRRKELVETGYPLLERIYREHQNYEPSAKSRPLCLLAPTWGPSSILATDIDSLISNLSVVPYDILVRPHPEFARREQKKMDQLKRAIQASSNVSLQTQLSSMQVFHEADLVITDHSAICFEFALGTERPVIFVDTPLRVDNPEWEKLGMVAVENECRSEMGLRILPSEYGRL